MCEALGSNPNRVKKKCVNFFLLKCIVCVCMCAYTLVYVQACVYMYVYTCGGSSTMCAWVAVMVISTWWSISLVYIFFEEVVCSSSLLSGLRLIVRIACL